MCSYGRDVREDPSPVTWNASVGCVAAALPRSCSMLMLRWSQRRLCILSRARVSFNEVDSGKFTSRYPLHCCLNHTRALMHASMSKRAYTYTLAYTYARAHVFQDTSGDTRCVYTSCTHEHQARKTHLMTSDVSFTRTYSFQ